MSPSSSTRLLLAFVALFWAGHLHAQTLIDRPDGALTLIGGWDFNGVGTATNANTLVARYNQQYSPYFASTLNANGNAALTSTLYFTNTAVGATFASNRNFNTANAPVFDIGTEGLTPSNDSLGDITLNARSILLSNNTTLDNARAVIALNTLTTFDRYENINVAYSARNQGAADATISWSYSIDGGFTFIPITGTTATISANSATFSVYTASFAGITAIEGRTDVLIGLNYSESAASASVFLDNLAIYGTAAPLATPPAISGLADLIVLEGDDAEFSATVTGAGAAPTYRWETSPYDQQTWQTVTGATGPVLSLTAVSGAAFAQYRLVVFNSTNNTTATSSAVRLLRAAVPAIAPEDQPQPQTINPGQTAVFAVVASGTDPLEYQWFKDDAPLADGSRISGATTAVLAITEADPDDSGDYTVEVRNAFGAVLSQPAALLVDAGDVAPSIVLQPAPVTVNSGGDATFVVVANGTPEPTYRWRRNGDPLSDGPGISGSATAELRLTGVTDALAGQYSVRIENEAGGVTSNAVALHVLFAPRIVAGGQPQSIDVNTGATAQFTVVAEGNPAPTYQWRRGIQNLVGQTGPTLTLGDVTLESAGNYSVVVTNSRGSVTSAVATLTVRSAPVITQQPQSVAGFVGGSATLRVTATGSPAVSYQWFRGEDLVPGATSATLTLSPLRASQAGEYTVRVTNAGGSETSQPATVTVGYDVVRQPAGGAQSFMPGSTLRLRTGIVSSDLRFQWYRNGVPIEGATTSSFDIASLGEQDGGVYSLRAFAPDGRVLINHVIGRVVVTRANSFRFLLRDSVSTEPVGVAIIQVANNLRVSGRLEFEDGRNHALRGELVETGDTASGTITITRAGAPALALSLDYDYSAVRMAGELTIAGQPGLAVGAATPPVRSPDWRGAYELTLARVSGGEPSASATLPVTIGNNGVARIAGRLADNTRYTASAPGDHDAYHAFYSRPHGRAGGYVAGELVLVRAGAAYSANAATSGNWFRYRPAAGARPEIDQILTPTLVTR